ncbi:unnamed protein product [Closterium sp. Yama58-4]|nr:unnamed protein product [Closterium sp. Yama58-4]
MPQRLASQHSSKPCYQPSRDEGQKPSHTDVQRRLVSISDPRGLPFRPPVAASVTTLPTFAEYRAKLALEKGGGGGGSGDGARGGKGERVGVGVEGVEGMVGRKRGKGRGLRREGSGECEKGGMERGNGGKAEEQKGDKEQGGKVKGEGEKENGDRKKRRSKVGERRRHHVGSLLLPDTVSEEAEGESSGVEASSHEVTREQADGERSEEQTGNELRPVEQAEGGSSGVEAEAAAEVLQGHV